MATHGVRSMIRKLFRAVVSGPWCGAHAILAAALYIVAGGALAADKMVFVTNWYAQAEHGGFYQALAEGIYQRYGLDVTIKMGGPQVNVYQLLLAGQADFAMGYDIATLN